MLHHYREGRRKIGGLEDSDDDDVAEGPDLGAKHDTKRKRKSEDSPKLPDALGVPSGVAPPLPDAKPIVAPLAVESPEPPGAEGAGAMYEDSPKRRRLGKKSSSNATAPLAEVVGFNPETDPRELIALFEEYKETTIDNQDILLERMRALFVSATVDPKMKKINETVDGPAAVVPEVASA